MYGGGYGRPPPQQYGYGQPQYGAPVQSADGAWMPPVLQQAIPGNCPPGLEYLTSVGKKWEEEEKLNKTYVFTDQLLVKQKVELLEAFTGFETANKYKVLNSLGQVVDSPNNTIF